MTFVVQPDCTEVPVSVKVEQVLAFARPLPGEQVQLVIAIQRVEAALRVILRTQSRGEFRFTYYA